MNRRKTQNVLEHHDHDQDHDGKKQGGKMTVSTQRFSLFTYLLIVISFIIGYLFHSHCYSQPQPQPQPSQQLANDDHDLLELHHSFPARCNPDPVPSSHVRQKILDRVFNGTSPWEGFPPAHLTNTTSDQPQLLWDEWIVGWSSTAPVFEDLIRQVRPKTIIEVGTYLGASATHMARISRSLGLNDTQIICVDDFRGWWPGYSKEETRIMKMLNGDTMLLHQFMQNVVKANATESILFVPYSATTALEGLCEWGVYGDLVEVDAAHDFHSVWADINNAYKVLRPGGVIFGHDYMDKFVGVKNAVDLFARLKGLRVRVHGEHWVLY